MLLHYVLTLLLHVAAVYFLYHSHSSLSLNAPESEVLIAVKYANIPSSSAWSMLLAWRISCYIAFHGDQHNNFIVMYHPVPLFITSLHNITSHHISHYHHHYFLGILLSICLISAVLGNLFFGTMADALGRKRMFEVALGFMIFGSFFSVRHHLFLLLISYYHTVQWSYFSNELMSQCWASWSSAYCALIWFFDTTWRTSAPCDKMLQPMQIYYTEHTCGTYESINLFMRITFYAPIEITIYVSEFDFHNLL